MAIKTDAMIAHNGANGYTLHVEYDPATEEFDAKAVFNDGTEKDLSGGSGGGAELDALIDRSITSVQSNAETVGEYAFRGCNNLLTADFPNARSIGSNAFYSCTAISNVNLPKVKEIGSFCFQSTAFKSVLLPKIEKIESNGFANCSKLKYVYLGPNASSIARNAFSSSTQEDLVIDCGFSSGAVSGAPWGATHATINYDVAEPNPPVGLSIAPDPGLIQNIDLEPLEEIQPLEPEPVEPEPVEVKKTTRKAAK